MHFSEERLCSLRSLLFKSLPLHSRNLRLLAFKLWQMSYLCHLRHQFLHCIATGLGQWPITALSTLAGDPESGPARAPPVTSSKSDSSWPFGGRHHPHLLNTRPILTNHPHGGVGGGDLPRRPRPGMSHFPTGKGLPD